MPRHIWTVFCRQPLFPQEGAQVSLIDVIQVITLHDEAPLKAAEEAPEGHMILNRIQASIVSLWTRSEPDEPERPIIRHGVRFPDDEQVYFNELEIDLESKAHGISLFNLPGVPVRGLGVYEWTVDAKGSAEEEWSSAASVPVELRYSPVPD